MPLELITLTDLKKFKDELFEEIRQLYSNRKPVPDDLLKSKEVCKLLRVSISTLQNMRRDREIHFIKRRGMLLYPYTEVIRLKGIKL